MKGASLILRLSWDATLCAISSAGFIDTLPRKGGHYSLHQCAPVTLLVSLFESSIFKPTTSTIFSSVWANISQRKIVLQEEFPDIPSRYIDLKYRETTQLFAAYQALDRESRSWEESADRPYAKLKRPRTQRRSEDLSFLDNMIPGGYGVEELKREIMAARRLRKKEDAKAQAKKDMSAAEAAKEKEYRDRGDVLECGTCCDDLPTYKFTHCDGDNPHFLCFGCLQNYANTEIGNQRYTLDCLHEEYVVLGLQIFVSFKFSC